MKKIISLHLTLLVLVLFGCQETKNKSITDNSEIKTDNSEVKTTGFINMDDTKFKSIEINGINIAYREAGNPENPTIVLLHGFPSSSHQYRKLLTALSNDYHLVAPDYPGFGNSDFPSPDTYNYTFDNIAKTINTFLEKKNLTSYTLFIQDYGAPIGFRIATAHPERVTAFINQNGNAYEEGLGPAWAAIQALWKNRNDETEKAILPAFSLKGLKWQYTHGTRNEKISIQTIGNWIILGFQDPMHTKCTRIYLMTIRTI